ncbi:MAG: hypothetical protein FH762_16990 [Firmicutes bacterium]|nr:hypothetical protein [Bacillota bacterium]
MLIYSAGLRVSEAASLMVNDIDSSRHIIRVRQSKGYKDRITLLSDKALESTIKNIDLKNGYFPE